ncbi:MAG TPA: hypothetical protein VN622_10935 [Clostridia bacterium]|nr:hypothetical protein [Clostridia bacterium]
MIDSNAALRAWLLSDPAIVALVGGRVYWPTLPQDHLPERDGLAITVSTRGGRSDAEMPIINPSVQIETWAPAGEHVRAREVYRAIYDLLHGACGIDLGANGYVLSCLEEVQGQDSIDPETKWATVLSFYRLMMRAN